jgi:hypothetical protein
MSGPLALPAFSFLVSCHCLLHDYALTILSFLIDLSSKYQAREPLGLELASLFHAPLSDSLLSILGNCSLVSLLRPCPAWLGLTVLCEALLHCPRVVPWNFPDDGSISLSFIPSSTVRCSDRPVPGDVFNTSLVNK